MKILLATDGSKFSEAAVDEVANKPWPKETEVKIVSVMEVPVIPVVEGWVPNNSYFEEMEQFIENQANQAVNKAAEKLRREQGENLKITTEVLSGYPKHVITDEANRWEADLIVVGSHGYRGLTKLWLGSVSQAVASHARCSVEIVRARDLASRPLY